MDELFAQSDFRSSEYCFSNAYNWRNVYGVQVGRIEGCLVIRCTKPAVTYSYPAGSGNIKAAVQAILDDAKNAGVAPVINCIQNEGKEKLETLFPGLFEFTYDRDTCDYIYTTESLTTLAGKKLHGKRNHINNFKAAFPNWQYEAITPDNLKDCWEMNLQWCKLYGCTDDDGLKKERCAVENAFMNFEAEGLKGGLLRKEPGSPVVAYTMGLPLNSDTFIVHIEKAFHDIQGAYPLINQQFVEHNCQDYTYVNREDDTGAEGLRKAKLSYRPAILVDKYYALLKEQP